jgi:hypothetical protein
VTDLNVGDLSGLIGDDQPPVDDSRLSQVSGLMEPAPMPAQPGMMPTAVPQQPPSLGELFTEFARNEPSEAAPPNPNAALKVALPPPMPARQRLQEWKAAQAERAVEPGESVLADDEPYAPSAAERAVLADPTESNMYTRLSTRAAAIIRSETSTDLAMVLGESRWATGRDDNGSAFIAAAELIERYATSFGDTPEFDFAVFDHLAASQKMSGRSADLWARFLDRPNGLREFDADELLANIARVGDIFDDAAVLADVELDPDNDVDKVVFGRSGPMLFTKAELRLDSFQVVAPSEDLLRAEAPPGRSSVLLGDGRLALVGFPSFRNAVALNKFTPVLVGVNDRAARWVPTEAARVRSVDDVRRVVDVDPGVVVESMLNTALAAFAGRHPGLMPEDVVMFSLPDNAPVPTGFDWEALEVGRTRFEFPDESEELSWQEDLEPDLAQTFRTADSARRFAIQVPAMLDVRAVADEMLLRGGMQVSVYARQPSGEGWTRYRERLFTDGVETVAVRSRDMDTVEPNSLYVWTKPSERLPDAPSVAVRPRQIDDNRIVFAGDVEVVGTEPLTIGAGVLSVRQNGRRVSRFAADAASRKLFVVSDEDTPAVLVTRNRDGSWGVTVDQSDDFEEAIAVAQMVRRAGANVTRLRSPRLRASFQQQVSVDIPSR